MSKQFLYRFSDDSEITREPTNATMDEIREIEKLQGIKLIYNGYVDQLQSLTLLRANSHKKKTDGFQPGWHPGLGMEIRTNNQYQEELKKRGMVEIGNEKQKVRTEKKGAFDEETMREIKSMGAEISDRQADALVKGEKLSE
jgi:hypothetical protein